MSRLATLLVLFVALQHVGFLVLEMFLWTQPVGLEIFKQTLEAAQASQVLAANQGLYNGFLAAGLFWGVSRRADGVAIQRFFLGCVLVAGLYGGATAGASILAIQAAPAALALLVSWRAHRPA